MALDTLSRQHVNYIDSERHVHELDNTPTSSWKDNDLTKLAGSSTMAGAGSPLDGVLGHPQRSACELHR